MTPARPLADTLDDALPQTQCTRCGYADCRSYAEAIASGAAEIDRCPPGGAEGIARLAALTGRAPRPLDPVTGSEGPRRVARIDEAACIGCTLCLQACPVDCILGGPKSMHTVMARLCTGCELCIPACPVDCIVLEPASGERTGWQAWSIAQADESRRRYDGPPRAPRAAKRLEQAQPAEPVAALPDRLAAVLARARQQRAGG